MPYRFLNDAPTADVGFAAAGPTIDDCFRAAADATLEVMVANPGVIQPRTRRDVHVSDERVELALLKFLEELIYYKDAEGLFLRAAQVAVCQRGGSWCVDAALEGEPIDAARHQLSGDVKAVTVHRLKVEQTSAGWEATVVLDV